MLAVSLLLALASPTGLACDSIPACVAVRDAVEVVRSNQRGWCGTPRELAHEELLELGPITIPYLARTLRDAPSPAVARFAAELLVELDAYYLVQAWCVRTTPATNLCADMRHRANALVHLDVIGTWYGTRTDRQDVTTKDTETDVAIRLRRDHHGLTGELCDDEHGCVDLDNIDFRGSRLALAYTRPAGPETVVLEILDGLRGGLLYSHGILHVAGCPKCFSFYSLTRLRPAP